MDFLITGSKAPTSAALSASMHLKNRVLITGQGRSGTSAIASIFFHLGYYMPSAHKLSTLEDSILRQYLKSSDIDAIVDELALRTKSNLCIAWKDPKLFGIAGKELAAALANDFLYVIVFRDPFAIAERNARSMNVDIDVALREASKSNMKLVDFYLSIKDSKPTYLISYEKLVTDRESVIVKLLQFIGVDNPSDAAHTIMEKMQIDHDRYLETANKRSML